MLTFLCIYLKSVCNQTTHSPIAPSTNANRPDKKPEMESAPEFVPTVCADVDADADPTAPPVVDAES
jgi:hypothetical protein